MELIHHGEQFPRCELCITFMKRGTVNVMASKEEFEAIAKMSHEEKQAFFSRYLRSLPDEVLYDALKDMTCAPFIEKDDIAVCNVFPETDYDFIPENKLGDVYSSNLHKEWYLHLERTDAFLRQMQE